jgi:hypothetical protein
MATGTAGTDASTSLVAVTFSQATTVLLPADLATINAAILDDQNVSRPAAYISGIGGFVREGLLYVPNRGFLRVLPGDVVAVDTTTDVGWPVLVSADAIANGKWNFT